MTKKRATSLDVAKRAGVSRTTVSFVLNNVSGVSISEETRQKVIEAAEKLDYHPDATGRRLVSGRSYTLGLVLRQSPEQVVTDALLPQVILGVEHAASLQNFHVLLKPLDPIDHRGYETLILENHVDGIILSGPLRNDQALIQLHQEGTPIVMMGQFADHDIPFVDIDAIRGAKTAVEHLIACGRRRIGLITNAPLAYTSAEQRHNGYAQALQEANLPEDRRLVQEGAFTPESGFQAMQKILEYEGSLDAVFVASDVVAMGALLAIKQSGRRIPGDISVIGFDDIPTSAYFDPPLTTIHTPAYDLGWAASDRLIHLINGEPVTSSPAFIEPKLIIRQSTRVGSP